MDLLKVAQVRHLLPRARRLSREALRRQNTVSDWLAPGNHTSLFNVVFLFSTR